jgi:hypothetical protein
MRRSILLILTLLLIATVVLSACGAPASPQASGGKATSNMVAASTLPKAMLDAPTRVRAPYQFAVANPDALKNVPCYCGCGAMGHTSNLSCYIKERKADGQIVYDEHALGCSLCVDIAQDVMRMTGEGKSPQAIRADIVATYSKFGPANQ